MLILNKLYDACRVENLAITPSFPRINGSDRQIV
jgi:hypothetical protein